MHEYQHKNSDWWYNDPCPEELNSAITALAREKYSDVLPMFRRVEKEIFESEVWLD